MVTPEEKTELEKLIHAKLMPEVAKLWSGVGQSIYWNGNDLIDTGNLRRVASGGGFKVIVTPKAVMVQLTAFRNGREYTRYIEKNPRYRAMVDKIFSPKFLKPIIEEAVYEFYNF